MDEITSFFKVKRNIVNTLLLLVMVAALPLGINLARQQQILRSRAAGDPIKFIGANVEKRADKWVTLDRNKPITLELISSLGAPGGSGGGSSPGGGGNGDCSVEWQLSNGTPAPDSTIQVKVKGVKDPKGWQNVELYLDGATRDFGWGGIEAGPTFVYNKVPTDSLGKHTLRFTTDKGKRVCTPEKDFNTVVTTSLPALMSLIPKGLVGEVKAQICSEGDERFDCSGQQAGCPVGQGERIKYVCKADLIFGDRTDWEYDSSYCDPECGDSGSGSSCTPDCSQEPNACSGETFGDGCGGTCVGSKDCGVGGIVFCPGYNQISNTGKLQWCSRGSIPPYGTDGKDCGWHPTLTEGCVDVDTGAGTGTQCPALTCEYSEVDSSCPSGYRIAKGIGATGFNEPGCTYKEGCSTSQCAPGDTKKQPPASTKPAGTTPATSSPPKTSSLPTNGAPKTSGAPSESPGTGTGTVTTVSYKIAESPDELSSAPENPYTGEPMIVNFDLKDKTPGNKFVWVEFKASNGRTARHNAQIRLLGDDPKIGSCFLTFEGQNTLVIITNPIPEGSLTFGKEKGSVQSGSSTLQIREWTDKFVSAVISNIAPGTSVPITLTNADGQKADAQCGSVSGLSLGAKVFCRAPQKHDTDNVDMTISEATPGALVARQKVRIDKDGNVQNLQTKLIEGRKYKVSLKAPRSLKRTVEFTAGEGITNLQNFVLPVGDIFPLESGDGKINSLDKAELNRQWVTAQSVSGRSGDFNQDSRINSIDWACMRYDFGKSDD